MADERTELSTAGAARWLLAGLALLVGLGLYFLYAPRTPEVFAPPVAEAQP